MKKILLLVLLLIFLVFGGQKVFAANESGRPLDIPLNWGSQKLQPFGDIINQDKNPNQSLEKWIHGAQNEKGELVIRGINIAIIDSLICYAVGCPPSSSNIQTNSPGGALGAMSMLIGTLYSVPPADTGSYIAYTYKNIMPKQANAQNITRGSDGLSAIVEIWGVFRNLAYVFFIIILVVIGFMIMFRHKIDPQTTVSVQNSLPHIVISMLLVTLSYAIAGLAIDISNVLTLLMAFALEAFHDPGAVPLPGFNRLLESWMGAGATKNIFELMNDIGNKASDGLATSINGIIASLTAGLTGVPLIGGMLGDLAALILAFAVIGAMFKTFFGLLSAYIQVIFLTIFSPLIILGGSMPGKSSVVKDWFKNLLSNTLVFPVLFIFLDIGAIISSSRTVEPWFIKVNLDFTNAWVPFGLSGFDPPAPLLPVPIGVFIKNLIGLGVVMTAPSIPQLVKEFFQTKESALGAGTAQALQGTLQKIPIVGSLIG